MALSCPFKTIVGRSRPLAGDVMLTTIMRICSKVSTYDIIEGLGTMAVTADVRVTYDRPEIVNYEPSIINFDAGDILLSEIIYTNNETMESTFIEEDNLTTEDLAILYVAVEASALSFIQGKIDLYINGDCDGNKEDTE